MKQRHVPQRTCVGCGQVRPKREMVRVVRLESGKVEVDPTGKRSGRGAYLCKKAACWDTALRRSALSRALKAEVAPEDRDELAQYSGSFEIDGATQSAPEAKSELSS